MKEAPNNDVSATLRLSAGVCVFVCLLVIGNKDVTVLLGINAICCARTNVFRLLSFAHSLSQHVTNAPQKGTGGHLREDTDLHV